MQLRIEITDDLAQRLEAASRMDSTSIAVLIEQAVRKELERFEEPARRGLEYDLAALSAQLQKLETGQRAILALLDASARVLASLIRKGETPVTEAIDGPIMDRGAPDETMSSVARKTTKRDP